MRYRKPSKVLDEKELLHRIAIHQSNISNYKMKKAIYGVAHAPPYLDMLIDHEEKELADCERELNLFYRQRQQESWAAAPKSVIQTFIDLVAPRSISAKRKRSKLFKSIKDRIYAFVGAMIVLGGIALVLVNRGVYSPEAQAVPGQANSSEEYSLPSTETLLPGGKAIVANTNGGGVILRYSPQDDSITEFVVSEGDSVELIEMIDNKDKGVWWKVRLSDGFVEGYIRREYIAPK